MEQSPTQLGNGSKGKAWQLKFGKLVDYLN